MAGAGDYKWYQRVNQKATGNHTVATGDTATVALIAAAVAKYTLCVQKITVSVYTDAAQSLTFQDNANTPFVIAKTKASPGLGPIVIDFGPEGVPLTEGKELDIAISGAGLGALVHAEGYYKQSSALAAQLSGQNGNN